MKSFPGKAENYFRSALAFKNPGDPEFCVEANWRVCKKFYPVENGESVSNRVANTIQTNFLQLTSPLCSNISIANG